MTQVTIAVADAPAILQSLTQAAFGAVDAAKDAEIEATYGDKIKRAQAVLVAVAAERDNLIASTKIERQTRDQKFAASLQALQTGQAVSVTVPDEVPPVAPAAPATE